ncbi:hypothetical protein [Archangium sp.]|uniref:hypothetical protein n=1 Tax=Archangium sp. TaxID=1872627 RepID=UPI00389A6C0D
MPRFIFANLQGLSEAELSERLVLLAQLLIESDVSVALLCEVMASSRKIEEAEAPKEPRFSARRPEGPTLFGEKVAKVFAQNEALRRLNFSYTRSYRDERYEDHQEGSQKGYGTLSKGPIETTLIGDSFKALSTRAPLRWVTPDGMHVYMLHAISNHGAAKKQLLGELIPALRKAHGDTPWMIVGDLNCPPAKLFKKDVDLSKGGQVLPMDALGFPDVFACIPGGATRWKSDNLLDYVISNVPCRVFRLPEETRGSRSERDSISALEAAEIDHRPILVEYPELDKKAGSGASKPSLSSSAPKPFAFALPTYPARFQRVPILADGNCLFRAIGHFSGHDHLALRAIAVNHLLQHWDEYQGFVQHPGYAADLAGNGVWAGHLALVALASHLDVQIVVYRFDGTQVRINENGAGGPYNVYYTGAHYDALVERQVGRPPRGRPRFGNVHLPFERFLVKTVTDEIRKLARRRPHREEMATVLAYVVRELQLNPRRSEILRRRDAQEATVAERVIRYLVRASFKFGTGSGRSVF